MLGKSNKHSVVFKADTVDDLDQRIKELEIDLTSFELEPANSDREQWQIERLLRALYCKCQLVVPVQLRKREKPDFLLEAGNLRIGIETTEAINPDYVRAQVHPAAQKDGAVVDPSLYRWGTAGRPKSQIREEAGRKQLSGDGWVGDDVEWEFGQSIIDVVRSKDEKLQCHYARYDSDHLLIYHNQPSPLIDIDKARDYAAKCLVDYWSQSGFDTVYVHKYNSILYFTRASSGILHEFPRSYKPLGIDMVTWQRLGTVEKLYLKLLEEESDFMQINLNGDSASAPNHLLDGMNDLQKLHKEWLADRARELLGRSYSHLLQPPDQIRLRTASEIAACPSALELFQGGVLEHVFRAVAKAVADGGTAEIPLLHREAAIDSLEFDASEIAVLHYLSAFDHMAYWAEDSRSCSRILEAIHRHN